MVGRAIRIAVCAAVLSVGLARAADPVAFTLVDDLAPDQIEETIAVYIDRVLVGTLHVDANRTTDQVAVKVAPKETYEYALCGRLVRRSDTGAQTTHEINNSGTLTNPGGRTYLAWNINNQVFYLAESDPNPDQTDTPLSPSRLCAGAVAGLEQHSN